jgi:hypothetical protein
MMHFIDQARDPAWLSELRESGLVTPDVTERIDAAMGRPESGTLNDFLLAGAEFIPEEPWLSWLIRRHGCHRYSRAVHRDEGTAWKEAGPSPEGNLPFRRGEGSVLLVALLRPDRREETIARHPGATILWAAATLREMRTLRLAWERGRSESVTYGPTAAEPPAADASKPGKAETSFRG